MKSKFIVLSLFLITTSLVINAEDAFQEFKVKRKNVFEFTKKPEMKEEKNLSTISFEVKDFCDVTIAVENSQGKIIRHLASGVLGVNAPAPFQKNSLKQVIKWDNKDDLGRYVDNLKDTKVRVSLGLQAEYEKDLYYSPYKRIAKLPIMAASPEGIYVFEGMGRDHVRLFDHDGKYVKTVYPFPASQLKNVKGLKWWKAPDGHKVPDKEGLYHNTLLTSGNNDVRTDQKGRQGGRAATGLAVKGKRIALLYEHLNRLSTDGSTGGFPLKGEEVGIKISKGGYGGQGTGKQMVGPTSAAFSPDQKILYMTGYSWRQRHGTRTSSIMGVFKMNYETNEPATIFAGKKSDKEYGNDDKHLTVPTSVDTDTKGNVYVSDFANHRVQVYDPSGKVLKTIKAKYPAKVSVHQVTGEVYVFSWGIIGLPKEVERKDDFNPKKIPQKITVFSAYPECKQIRQDKFSFGATDYGYIAIFGQTYQLTLDSWTKEPSFWVVGRKYIPGPDDRAAGGIKSMDFRKLWDGGARKVQLVDGKWKVVFDVTERAKKDIIRLAPPHYNIQQLYFNPKSEKLYVGEPDSAPTGKAWCELIEIDPNTMKTRIVKLPINPQDMAFDLNGLIYLRTMNVVSRFDMSTMKEVPFDYGIEKASVGKDGGIGGVSSPVISAIMLPSKNVVCYHQGGMSINVNGDIAVTCGNNLKKSVNTEFKFNDIKETATYKEPEYPGRAAHSISMCLHIWDKFGKIKSQNVIKGSPQTDGVAIDKDCNVFMLATPPRLIKGKPFDYGMSSTLIKFSKTAEGRFLSKNKKRTAIPLDPSSYPKRPTELRGLWVNNYEWMYGGVGFGGFNGKSTGCACWFVRFKLDYFARSFVPEPMQYSVAVLDSAGNLILKIGQYGNEDSKGKNSKEPLGGDEVGLFHPCFVATHSDRRLFIADIGNENILSVKLKYVVNEFLTFKNSK
ncbi:MAG: hypothetical protein COA79_15540 [Planctomycetota bacterium]|nr:MAG: hypothetical protein COA79_15540 [Planctomycetota bacterium]